ncbi:MAG: enoyl-CoA hydratase/isomerase family protein [Phyllobacteriaceae bacterium]|nr:enoyl-CoA hydratase/isomerase family protein [Phyllobacteriaceae bacterium]
MEFPAYRFIAAIAQNRVVSLTLNDPGSMNALSAALVGEVEVALDVAVAGGARALVLRGAGGAFSAGGDVKAMLAAIADPPAPGEDDPIAAMNRAGGRFFARYAALPFATIALVDGMAAGGGFGLAAASDFVIAAANAKFALTEASLGLVPAQIAPYVIARLGRPKALQLVLSCRRLGGREAAEMGLADIFAEDGEAALAELLAELTRAAPGAAAATKALFARAGHDDGFLEEAARVFAAAVRGTEAGEGIAAFMARRKPKWAEE